MEDPMQHGDIILFRSLDAATRAYEVRANDLQAAVDARTRRRTRDLRALRRGRPVPSRKPSGAHSNASGPTDSARTLLRWAPSKT